MRDGTSCRICGATTTAAGSKRGTLTDTTFLLRRCTACGFAFVANPYEDYARIYDERYYRGAGADRLVDYVFELEHPGSTIRQAEWQGIIGAVGALRHIDQGTRWLDFGCGNGGLVRKLRESRMVEAVGFETGWIAERARAHGVPVLTDADLAASEGRFDVVTAIDVIEHVIEPLEALRTIRRVLKPGGLLFLTTGNVAPHADLARWDYVCPEVHVSFFEPRTLELAMSRSGFRPERRGFLPGFVGIIRFKVLKKLGLRRNRRVFDALPWTWIARGIDARLAVSAHPIGWAA